MLNVCLNLPHQWIKPFGNLLNLDSLCLRPLHLVSCIPGPGNLLRVQSLSLGFWLDCCVLLIDESEFTVPRKYSLSSV